MEKLSQYQSLYEKDYYLWLQKTSEILQTRQLNQLDIDNLKSEIENLKTHVKESLQSRLITLIKNLLKLKYWTSEKECNARGWLNNVIEQRLKIELSLEDSPSLRTLLDEIFFDCYEQARTDTLKTHQLPRDLFPLETPFSLEDILNSDYLP